MDLDIARVVKSIPKKHEQEELAPLMTPWGEALAADVKATPLPEHPRPQFARKKVWVLNGWWHYAFATSPNAAAEWAASRPPEQMEGRIRVPFSPEATLSGVGRQLQPDELLWYRCRLGVPSLADGERCILHFDGVDYACAVYLGGVLVGTHEGAYQPFSFDVTDLLSRGATVMDVCVFDPSDTGTQLKGKQRLERGGMWYTAQSGIWQTVWLEVVPSVHINELRLVADPDRGELQLTAWVDGAAELALKVVDADDVVVAQASGRPVAGVSVVELTARLEHVRLWSPEDPYLYRLSVVYGEDQVRSYCAFRTISLEKDAQGVLRLCLNHQPYFFRGLLDQGYWPDGLMTPPSDEAMIHDLQMVRDLGFNTVRKHIKTEPERWYWHCDRMGVLVWQDMPSGGDAPNDRVARDLPTLFKDAWHRLPDTSATDYKLFGAADPAYRHQWTENAADTVSRLSNHPCIALWVLFNESWGQFDAAMATQRTWELDPTRPVLSVSGWYDQGTGDVHGVHNYFRGMHMFPDPYAGRRVETDELAFGRVQGTRARMSSRRGARAQVVSECGGLTWHVDGHSSLEHSYGYVEFETEEAWLSAVSEFLDKADLLESEGLSGFIYTQLSDVEEETNGLLTYDRKVCKLQ